MSVAETPYGPLWTTSRILAAVLLIGTVLSFGTLPIFLLALYLHFVAIRFVFRLVSFSAKKSRDGVKHVAQQRRSERLRRSSKQAQSLVQIAPHISAARDYGEVRSILSNIPGLPGNTLEALKALKDAEQSLLDAVRHAYSLAIDDPDFGGGLTGAQKAAAALLNLLKTTPVLPAPELANGWLSFHEDTRMSVQEIQTTLATLQKKTDAVTALEAELQTKADQANQGTELLPTPEVKGKMSLDQILVDLDATLKKLPADTDAKTYQDLFELSQSIDAAFLAVDRQPPQKLSLVADDVRRVHQIETLLSVYREKLDKLDQEKAEGKVNDDTYQTMKSSWERALESEMSAFESAQ